MYLQIALGLKFDNRYTNERAQCSSKTTGDSEESSDKVDSRSVSRQFQGTSMDMVSLSSSASVSFQGQVSTARDAVVPDPSVEL
jgi:hypothetical protein